MSNVYRKLQWRALRPNGDNIQPYKIACLAQNEIETRSQSLFTLLKINDIARLQAESKTGSVIDSSNFSRLIKRDNLLSGYLFTGY